VFYPGTISIIYLIYNNLSRLILIRPFRFIPVLVAGPARVASFSFSTAIAIVLSTASKPIPPMFFRPRFGVLMGTSSKRQQVHLRLDFFSVVFSTFPWLSTK
jgi:hypothetical protein